MRMAPSNIKAVCAMGHSITLVKVWGCHGPISAARSNFWYLAKDSDPWTAGRPWRAREREREATTTVHNIMIYNVHTYNTHLYVLANSLQCLTQKCGTGTLGVLSYANMLSMAPTCGEHDHSLLRFLSTSGVFNSHPNCPAQDSRRRSTAKVPVLSHHVT